MNDTIFALSTVPGRSGVAVVRVSGPDAWISAKRVCPKGLASPRMAVLRDILDPATGDLIDRGLVLSFQEGASFTGENIVEYQIHGGFSVANGLCEALGRELNHRPAEPGEFSRRALENGRLDLVQLEGLADLIDAETDSQRRLAHRVFGGALSEVASTLRKRLIRALALLESTLDFSDEELPAELEQEARSEIMSALEVIDGQVRGASAAKAIRDGFEVAIIGRPNVGKSTLLNAIAGRDAALTSEVEGTTRDIIEVRFDLNGLAVTFLDMAGIRETDDKVESLGVDRARRRAEYADLSVFLVEKPGDENGFGIPVNGHDLVVGCKADVFGNRGVELSVSGRTGGGVERLLDIIASRLANRVSGASLLVRERQLVEFRQAGELLSSALAHVDRGETGIDLAAENVKAAVRNLDRIVGRIDVEDLLDEIFSSFCIGK